MPRFGKPGEQIGYTVYPCAGGPPIVLVHGFTASSASFAANVPALNDRFEVVSAELLGHGESESPGDAAPYAPDAAVARILALFDELGHEKVLLCGHSLGAALCLRLALEAPQRLAGLILINSMSAAGTPEWREDARPGMVAMALRLRAEGSDFLRQTRLYPAQSKRLDPESRELLMRAFDATDANGLAGTAEGLVIDVNSFERLGELAVPTLVVVGDRDRAFAEAAPAFIGRMPAGVVREVHLEKAGHAANIEQPRAFEAAVTAFAEDLGYLTPAMLQAAAMRSKPSRGGSALTAVGGGLVLGGLALLAGAFFVARGDDDSTPALASVAESATNTPTPLSLVAGTRSAGPGPGAGAGSNLPNTPLPGTTTANPEATAATAEPSQAAVATNPATATARPAATATATPPPEATPASTAVPPSPSVTPMAPTAAPSGPRASISGPGAASVGSPASFVGSSSGGTVFGQPRWTASNGTVATANLFAPVITFTQAGCQTVTVSFFFAGGAQTQTASMLVPVGGATC